ncbi:SDR family NAD(P)-dependent oxidoreductase [Streptomyces sp. NPDC102360]|uniref:SDR family NAD(P)-dependent oxidoreductase n=1 Tax=Streptomyces sp. NPDC102360 TaxID=3366160 RepID=UPI0037FD9421
MAFPDPFDLTAKVALVTGAGGGLGAAFARMLATAGATVVCADINGAAAKSVADEMVAAGLPATAVELDVTDESRVDVVVQQVAAEQGALDILVNNAGIGDPHSVPLHELPTSDWRRVLAVNLDGVFLCSRAALRVMTTQGSGKIVNIASMYGLHGSLMSAVPAYTTTKGAVVNMTREVGLEYAASNIQVNALCPGFVQTEAQGGLLKHPKVVDRLSKNIPMGRVAMPEDIAGALLMLSSSASDYMTGQTLVIDGGVSAA